MPFYPPRATAPPNPLPEWIQDLVRSGRDWGGGAHVPSLALKAAIAMLPEAGTRWAAGEYEPGQAIPPGDWMPDVVGGAAPGVGMSREWPEYAGKLQRKLSRWKQSPKDFSRMEMTRVGGHARPEAEAWLAVGGRNEPVLGSLPWAKNNDSLSALLEWLDQRFGAKLNEFSWGPDVYHNPGSVPALERMREFFGNDYPLMDYKLERAIKRARGDVD